jgi:hypothetical protein
VSELNTVTNIAQPELNVAEKWKGNRQQAAKLSVSALSDENCDRPRCISDGEALAFYFQGPGSVKDDFSFEILLSLANHHSTIAPYSSSPHGLDF